MGDGLFNDASRMFTAETERKETELCMYEEESFIMAISNKAVLWCTQALVSQAQLGVALRSEALHNAETMRDTLQSLMNQVGDGFTQNG